MKAGLENCQRFDRPFGDNRQRTLSVAQAYNFVALVYNTVCMCYRDFDKQWGRCLECL
jgi:hypothetical protein